jgi:hypothetical protein
LKTNGKFSAEICALLHLGLPEGATTWSSVAACGAEAERTYWERAHGYSQENFERDAPIAVEKLLDADRPVTALEISGNPKVSIRSTILQRLLEAVVNIDQSKHPVNGVMLDFYVAMAFKQLYERNELPIEEIARLEWPFADAFDDIRKHTNSPLALHRLLQSNPSWFVQLISFIYKRDDRTLDAQNQALTEEQRTNRASNARSVLESWNLIPGFHEDGNVDEGAMIDWIDATRSRCAADHRVIACDLEMAKMLARSPADPDGAWPHVTVRNQIERLKNEIIDKHFLFAVRNNRGVVSRGLFDGGQKERNLAERYQGWADKIGSKWPRTAAILRTIARSYESQANYEDISADLLDLR